MLDEPDLAAQIPRIYEDQYTAANDAVAIKNAKFPSREKSGIFAEKIAQKNLRFSRNVGLGRRVILWLRTFIPGSSFMPGSFAGTFQERLSQKCSPLLVSNFLHSFLQSVGAGSRDSSKNAKVGDTFAILRNHRRGEA